MGQDIFKQWKSKKFIIAPGELHNKPGHLVVLTDFSFWLLETGLENWCSKHNCEISGMTVVIPDDETLSLFCLAWA